MPVNKIYPFATGAGANVLSTPAYESLTARATGYQAGRAASKEVNTTLRQSSIIASMVAQFIVDNTNTDVLDDGDLAGLLAKFTTAIQTKVNSVSPSQAALLHYGVDTGTVNTLTVNVSPDLTALATGLVVVTIPAQNNTGVATLNADGLGATSIRRPDGTTLVAGDIRQGTVTIFIYDGSNWRMKDLPSSANYNLIHSGDDTSVTANSIVCASIPAPTAYVKGDIFTVKIANSVTGATTINFNSLGAKSVLKADGSPTKSSDLIAGQQAVLVYDGVNFQIANFSPINIPARNTLQFLTSGNFTVPAGIFKIKARVWGGGGGGGGAKSTSQVAAGSGGGGGGYAEDFVFVTPGQIISYVVGAGGVAGNASPGDGGAGGISGFATVSANGGTGGSQGNNDYQRVTAGSGGTATAGFNVNGSSGGFPFSVGANPGAGFGGSSYSSASPSINIVGMGGGGIFPGGGANGGSSNTSNPAFQGGSGAAGLIVIEY